MPSFERGQTKLYYEETGTGFPILLFAPGGMRSAIGFWENSPWNPIKVLSPHFRVIAMDQRNAGRSTAPVTAGDGWHTYADDHVALLDHLGVADAAAELEIPPAKNATQAFHLGDDVRANTQTLVEGYQFNVREIAEEFFNSGRRL